MMMLLEDGACRRADEAQGGMAGGVPCRPRCVDGGRLNVAAQRAFETKG